MKYSVKNLGQMLFAANPIHVLIVCFAAMLTTAAAYAFVAPAAGDFAFEVYDFVVLRILNGPIGFVLGVAAMAFGALQAFRNAVMQGIVIGAAGILVMNAENLVTALGAVV